MLEDIESQPNVSLTPVERLLLSTDGTVTHALEALTRSPVEVDIIHRTVEDGVLERVVALKRDGQETLVYAESQVYLDRLDNGVAEELVDGDAGIGDLLREVHAETAREVETMATEWVPGDDDRLPGVGTLALRRTYSIISGEKAIITITELFPKGRF